ncbi:Ig-like domain-containing protein [Aestuariibacter sp. AA17]|uniref:Ig-like domain-containing protein n=1 Tax=Fluctibacter corallii TaxID=2984329 RepID=A0ABT3A4A7_9ALTE|nr:Ig-like domain-containing protein [Aestuariibacter sp. AA17]MCV2883216.1 Ig-like domain-containing protein [Aestuariibacter sp. AA17]
MHYFYVMFFTFFIYFLPFEAISKEIKAYPDFVKTNGFLKEIHLDVLSNDSCGNVDNNLCQIRITEQPLYEDTVEVNQNSIIYRRNSRRCGKSDFADNFFSYQLVNDDGIKSVPVKVILDLDCSDRSPIAIADTYYLEKGSVAKSLYVTGNDIVPATSYRPTLDRIVTGPAYGDAKIESNRIIYSTDATFCGTDTIRYTVVDAQQRISKPATITLHVSCDTVVPVTTDDSYTVRQHKVPDPFPILDNDILPVGVSTIEITSQPVRGRIVQVDENQQIVYRPTVGNCAPDKFIYRLKSALGVVSRHTIVTINFDCSSTTPIANDDYVSVVEDRRRDINILDNDHAFGHGPIVIDHVVTVAEHGDLVVGNNQQTLTWIPTTPDYCGKDSFSYQARNDVGEKTELATVSVVVACVFDFPIAQSDVIEVYGYDNAIINVLENDEINDLQATEVIIETPPRYGRAYRNSDKTSIRYTPSEGIICYEDRFSYRIVGKGFRGERVESRVADVKIKPVCDDKTPRVRDRVFSLLEDRSQQLNLISNAIDPIQGGLKIYDFPNLPKHFSLHIDVSNQRVYAHPIGKDYCGRDTFSYRVVDADGVISREGQVVLDVQCVEDKITVNHDSYVVSSDVHTKLDVLKNDINPDNAQVQIFAKDYLSSQFGGITKDQKIVYVPAKGACDYTTSMLYEARMPDGTWSSSARVTVKQVCKNDPPTARDDSLRLRAGRKEYLHIFNNDYDPDKNDSLKVKHFNTLPRFGELSIDEDTGYVIYQSYAGICGVSDSFTYTLEDLGGLVSNEASVLITEIQCTHSNPIVVDDTATVLSGNSVALDPLANDYDPDGDRLFIDWARVKEGEIQLTTDYPQSLVFTPHQDYCGEIDIQYGVVDANRAARQYGAIEGKIVVDVLCGDLNSDVNQLSTPNYEVVDMEHVVVRWGEVNNVDYYKLQQQVHDGEITTQTYTDFEVGFENALNYISRFRVAGCNISGCGNYSLWTSWVGEKPSVPASPYVYQDDSGQHISWGGLTNAQEYVLELNYDDEGWIQASRTPFTEFHHNSELTGTRIYRVSACNMVGCSEFSHSSNLIGGPVPQIPLAPFAEQVGGCQYIRWTPVSGASSHKLEMKFNTEGWMYVNSAEESFEHCSDLIGERVYRVAACNQGGCSAFSPESNVIGGAIPNRIFISPIAVQRNSGQKISWNSAKGATRYIIEVNFNDEGWLTVSATSALFFEHNSYLAGQRRYRVSACNKFGCNDPSPPSNMITLEVPILEWSKSKVTIAEPLTIVGVPNYIEKCISAEQSKIEFLNKPIVYFYSVTSGEVNRWNCYNIDGSLHFVFDAPLSISKLPKPNLSKSYNR